MILTMTQSVRRQLNEKIQERYLMKMRSEKTKDKRLKMSLRQHMIEIQHKINAIGDSLHMLEEGYSFTRQGWIQR